MPPRVTEANLLSGEARGADSVRLRLATLTAVAEWLLVHPVFLFAAIFTILVARCPDALRFPELAWEDGNQMLGFFFNSPEFTSALRRYNGYVQLMPNVMAWLATRGPVTLAPQIFTLAAITFAATGIFLVSRPRMSWLIPHATDRAVVALLLALLPLGKSYVVYNLAYSLWSCLFVLIMLVAGPLPRSGKALALCTAGIVLGILSHPLSLIILPILLIHLVLDKGFPQRICVAICIGTIVAYQLFGVERGAPIALSPESIHLSVRLFLSRVVFELLVGTMAGTTLIPDNAQFVHYSALTILAGLAAWTLANKLSLGAKAGVAIAVGLAFGLIFASTAARLATGPDLPHVFKFYLQRYFYVPKLIMGGLLLAAAIALFRSARSSLPGAAQVILLAGCGVHLLGLNRANNRLYENVHADGVKVAQFLAQVRQHVQLARAGSPYTAEWVMPREEGWEIRLDIDRHLNRRGPSDRNTDHSK